MLGGLNPCELLFELEQNSAGDHDEEGKGDDCSQPVVDFAGQAVQGGRSVPSWFDWAVGLCAGLLSDGSKPFNFGRPSLGRHRGDINPDPSVGALKHSPDLCRSTKDPTKSNQYSIALI